MAEDLKIEDAKVEDLKTIRTIVRDAWVELYPNEKYGITAEDISAIDWFEPAGMERRKRQIIEKSEKVHTWVVKDDKNKILGFCKAAKEDGFGEIDAMYVVPEMKGRGLGRKLIEKAFEWLGGEKDIILKVVAYNSRAIGFYKKMGFEDTGKNVSYRGTQLPSGIEIPRIEMLKKNN